MSARLYAATGERSPASTRRATRGPLSCRSTGAGARASRSIPPMLTWSTPGSRATACGGRRTAAARGSPAGSQGRRLLARGQCGGRRRLRRNRAEHASSAATTAAETWRELEALLEFPSRPTWSFPPRPWTSHVRWIAPSPHDADLLLVGIELGGLMRSTDGGETWQDHRPGAQRDVHSLAWHPRVPGRAYEAGGGGAAWSDDGGETWQPADDGRDRHYTWAVAVDPDDPDSGSSPRAPGHSPRTAGATRKRASTGARTAVGAARGRPPGAAPGDAVRPRRRRGPALRRARDGQLWESGDRGDSWRRCELQRPR